MQNRTKMKAHLCSSNFPSPKTAQSKIRTVKPNDLNLLSLLFYNGFKESIDYNGESKSNFEMEIKTLFKGLYGPFLFDCSYVYEEKKQVISASIIILFKNIPLLMYAVTLPEYKNKGIFTQLLQKSMITLQEKGYHELYLVVTDENQPAKYLYKKLGFREIDRKWSEILNK
jgi:GNAT superfamily N-acetyltransferase